LARHWALGPTFWWALVLPFKCSELSRQGKVEKACRDTNALANLSAVSVKVNNIDPRPVHLRRRQRPRLLRRRRAFCQSSSVDVGWIIQTAGGHSGRAEAERRAGQSVGGSDSLSDQFSDEAEAGVDVQDEGGVHEAGY